MPPLCSVFLGSSETAISADVSDPSAEETLIPNVDPLKLGELVAPPCCVCTSCLISRRFPTPENIFLAPTVFAPAVELSVGKGRMDHSRRLPKAPFGAVSYGLRLPDGVRPGSAAPTAVASRAQATAGTGTSATRPPVPSRHGGDGGRTTTPHGSVSRLSMAPHGPSPALTGADGPEPFDAFPGAADPGRMEPQDDLLASLEAFRQRREARQHGRGAPAGRHVQCNACLLSRPASDFSEAQLRHPCFARCFQCVTTSRVCPVQHCSACSMVLPTPMYAQARRLTDGRCSVCVDDNVPLLVTALNSGLLKPAAVEDVVTVAAEARKSADALTAAAAAATDVAVEAEESAAALTSKLQADDKRERRRNRRKEKVEGTRKSRGKGRGKGRGDMERGTHTVGSSLSRGPSPAWSTAPGNAVDVYSTGASAGAGAASSARSRDDASLSDKEVMSSAVSSSGSSGSSGESEASDSDSDSASDSASASASDSDSDSDSDTDTDASVDSNTDTNPGSHSTVSSATPRHKLAAKRRDKRAARAGSPIEQHKAVQGQGKRKALGKHGSMWLGMALHQFVGNQDSEHFRRMTSIAFGTNYLDNDPRNKEVDVGIVLCPGVGRGHLGTGNLPTGLVEALKKRTTDRTVNPKVVALGSHGHYYLGCSNEASWSSDLPESFHDAVSHSHKFPVQVAFGQKRDSWFVMYDTGECAWNALPTSLRSQLMRAAPAKVVNVSMAPDGRWFAKFNDGTMAFRGLEAGDTLFDNAKYRLPKLANVHSVVFGDQGQLLVRFSVGKAGVSTTKAAKPKPTQKKKRNKRLQ